MFSIKCSVTIYPRLNPRLCPISFVGNVTMLLAMGRDDGVGQFNGYKLPRFLVTKGKSESLLLWKSWREMGQKAPS